MSGVLSGVASAARDVRQVSSAIAGTARAVTDGVHAVDSLFSLGGGGASGLLGGGADFYDQLQPASWRGLDFAVLGSRVRAGRRKALHEYPFRDGVWVEDLGKRGRVYGFDGFLIGDDVGAQVKTFVESMERAGPGPLVHPTFGSSQCEVIDFEAGEEWDAGRVWRFRVEFLEPVARGLQLQPATAKDTVGAVSTSADQAEAATSGSFIDSLKSGIGQGVAAVQRVQAAVQPYVSTAVRLVGDATRVVNSVRGLAGSFGRYASGRGVVTPSVQGVLTTTRQVQGAVTNAIGAASAARSAVVQAGSALTSLAGL